MKYRIKYLPTFPSDRNVIRKYLSQFYVGTEKRFFLLLRKKINYLREFPFSCSVYEHDPDYRRLVVGDYLVFYTVNEDLKVVEVHRILHGSQNINKVDEHVLL